MRVMHIMHSSHDIMVIVAHGQVLLQIRYVDHLPVSVLARCWLRHPAWRGVRMARPSIGKSSLDYWSLSCLAPLRMRQRAQLLSRCGHDLFSTASAIEAVSRSHVHRLVQEEILNFVQDALDVHDFNIPLAGVVGRDIRPGCGCERDCSSSRGDIDGRSLHTGDISLADTTAS